MSVISEGLGFGCVSDAWIFFKCGSRAGCMSVGIVEKVGAVIVVVGGGYVFVLLNMDKCLRVGVCLFSVCMYVCVFCVLFCVLGTRSVFVFSPTHPHCPYAKRPPCSRTLLFHVSIRTDLIDIEIYGTNPWSIQKITCTSCTNR